VGSPWRLSAFRCGTMDTTLQDRDPSAWKEDARAWTPFSFPTILEGSGRRAIERSALPACALRRRRWVAEAHGARRWATETPFRAREDIKSLGNGFKDLAERRRGAEGPLNISWGHIWKNFNTL